MRKTAPGKKTEKNSDGFPEGRKPKRLPAPSPHRQRPGLLRGLGHRRRSARPGPSAHPRGDEDQVGSGDGPSDVRGRLLRRGGPQRGVPARAKAAGEFGPELELVEAGAGLEGLGVGVDGPELDALEVFVSS